MVAAGAIVGPGTVIPAGEIWGGKPAKYLRALTPEEQAFLKGVFVLPSTRVNSRCIKYYLKEL